jgi:hypothetical protein
MGTGPYRVRTYIVVRLNEEARMSTTYTRFSFAILPTRRELDSSLPGALVKLIKVSIRHRPPLNTERFDFGLSTWAFIVPPKDMISEIAAFRRIGVFCFDVVDTKCNN